MDSFFNSVFSDDTEGSSNLNPNPWTFLKTIASKSESAIRKETAIIRELAARAVKDLPASLDAGAEVAQRSLESVGDAVDNLGSTVTRIITGGNGKESDGEKSDGISQNPKPYSRLDAQIRMTQCDMKTYCEEPEDFYEYNEWKLGFILDDKADEIEDLIEENEEVKEIYSEVVPNIVDDETFWIRYFYKVDKIERAEEVRAEFVKRAVSREEEELTWDVDEEDDDNGKSEPELNLNQVGDDKLVVNAGEEEEELPWDVEDEDV